MAVSIEELRALGERRVSVVGDHGSFDGTIVQRHLGEHSIMLLLAQDGDDGDQVVIPIESILQVVER